MADSTLKLNKKRKKKSVFNLRAIIAEAGNGIDMPFLAATFALLIFGLVMLYSASYVKSVYSSSTDSSTSVIKTQLICAALGIVGMFVVSKLDYNNFIKRWALALYAVSFILLIAVLFSTPVNGCRRWISIPGIGTFQPSEIAKLAIILNVSHLLDNRHGQFRKLRDFAPFVYFLAPVILLLALEPHNSCIIIILMLVLILMFVGDIDMRYFFIGGGVLVLCVGAYVAINWHNADAYFVSRITSFLNSRSSEDDLSYQTYMSLLAIGSGNWFGLGLGNSRQKHMHLPEAQNDFIYAIVVEELGFVGGLIVIALFMFLVYRGIRIALHAKDRFGTLITFGIVCQIAIQAGLNIAVNTNLIPNTGISLPFFSQGGTALIILLGEIGLVLSVSRTCVYEKENEDESDNSSGRDSRPHKSGPRNRAKDKK